MHTEIKIKGWKAVLAFTKQSVGQYLPVAEWLLKRIENE
jgi:hypothetical protein